MNVKVRSLQSKFTFALLLTSLTSVVLVGVVARGSMLRKFNQNSMEQSFQSFRGDLSVYLSTYGSWERADQAIDFRDWMHQRRNSREMQPGSNSALAPNSERRSNPPPNEPSLDNEGRIPPPPRETERGGKPPNGGAEGRGPRQNGDRERSFFRFVVLDPAGRVLVGPPNMRGRNAPLNWRADAKPVIVGGKVAVLVVPYGEPVLTAQDEANLTALKSALLRGIAAAMLMAVALGLFFGHRLSGKLRELTGAIEAMGNGNLRQRVEVKSRDEIGVLAEAFNRMSEELVLAQEKLQKSHFQITEQAAQLQELSVRDELTQLFNRRYFDAQTAQLFEQSKRYGRPLTLMIGDLDHFKRINDTFSHATGDEVLRHVAEVLGQFTRQCDVVARYGGEEFVIAFPETPLEQALALCERLRSQIENYSWSKVQPGLRVTMSLGLCDDVGLESAEKMIAAADELLYYAKEHGRNRVCIPETLRTDLKCDDLLQIVKNQKVVVKPNPIL